jgi:hypothetical protein
MPSKLRYKIGDCVYVKGVGAAKVNDLIGGTYFLYFYNGKSGQGWKDHDIEKPLTGKQFWSEWRRYKAFN